MKGFFTDTTLCIGCKACEVACKQWNQLPDDGFNFTGLSYDNTGHLGSSTWRHVSFVERPVPEPTTGTGRVTRPARSTASTSPSPSCQHHVWPPHAMASSSVVPYARCGSATRRACAGWKPKRSSG